MRVNGTIGARIDADEASDTFVPVELDLVVLYIKGLDRANIYAFGFGTMTADIVLELVIELIAPKPYP